MLNARRFMLRRAEGAPPRGRQSRRENDARRAKGNRHVFDLS
jgi:hypothetical protein